MKFAHMADCHIGSYRDPKLRDVSAQAFVKAVDKCIMERVDFVLIAGDLFNTSLPGMDQLKIAVQKLKELRDSGIRCYVIAGSHDYSPSGKTMLDVLEEAGLFVNAVKGDVRDGKLCLKFTKDEKTGAKITGILGRRGMLEKSYYESLDLDSLEKEEGMKIFMFHTALSELKQKGQEQMESSPISFLPKGFDYYAGGHVHIVKEYEEKGYAKVVYPGPLFPNSFSELEDIGIGGFYIWEDGKLRREYVQIHPIQSFSFDAENKTPEEAEKEIMEAIMHKEFIDMIITIRVYGSLKSGKPSDIRWQTIFSELYDKGAYFVMKNVNKLQSKEFEEVKVSIGSVNEVEEKLINEHLGKIKIDMEEKSLIKSMMRALNSEKDEGEKVYEYEDRIKKEIDSIIRS